MDNLRIKITRLFVGLLLLAGAYVQAAPFDKTFPFTQPDGTVIELWGKGDEFSAVFEHNGYSVVFDPSRGAYMYARLNADETELAPTWLEVGKTDPAANGLQEHVRVSPEAVRAQRRARFEQWDADMEISSRWQASKARMQALRAQAADGGRGLRSPPNFETVGSKVGFTLLIDFDNNPASIPQADIVDFLNGDGYTGYGNTGSVKEYFHDVSKGLLTYTNIVTAYVRIPNSLHPKSYYNDVSQGAGTQANKLITDALNILKTMPSYNDEILPYLDALTTEGGRAVAFNVFYAGGNGDVWSMGLWPHSGGLSSPQSLGNGVSVSRYQITNIGDSLTIRTFCHENGHMLCGFPDFYDYAEDGTDSIGGTGNFCLMGYGGDDHNPVHISAYMKVAAGWAEEVIDVLQHQYREAELATVSLEGNPNRFYRFQKPGTPKEYYLIENRQRIGRDRSLPASGLAIWHIDEDGNRSDERRVYNTSHQNFEQTLVQADNLWHLHRRRDIPGTDANYGDANDLWYLGNTAVSYANLFTDNTTPSARWWDGSVSYLRLEEFSASGTIMTFVFQALPPTINSPSDLPTGRVGTPYQYTLSASGGAKPYAWAVEDGSTLPLGLTLDSVSGRLTGIPMEHGNLPFVIAVTGGDSGKVTTKEFTLTINPCFSAPYEQNFDATTSMPDGWHQTFLTNTISWVFCPGSDGSSYHPATAHSAPNNARLGVLRDEFTNSVTRLISPMIDFGSSPYKAELTFWHYMERWGDDVRSQDKLRVYYSTTTNMEWVLLQEFSSNVGIWTQRRITLPDPSQTYYIAFEGVAMYGYGIHIDDVWIGDPTLPLQLLIPPDGLPEAVIDQPYSNVLSAIGGEPPYTFSITVGGLPPGFGLDPDGLISGIGTAASESSFTLRVTDAMGKSVEADLTLSIAPPRATFFAEGFESGTFTYRGWTQEWVTNRVDWEIQPGGGNANSILIPRYPHSGNFNATLYSWKTGQERPDHVTRLISPVINLGAAPSDISLTFWHCMAELQGDLDTLRVYVRSVPGDTWRLQATYTNDVPVWTKRTLQLPDPTSTYQIMFEGNARYGAGVCLDDIRITQDAPAPIFITTSPLKDGAVWQEYNMSLVAAGGVEPYTFGASSDNSPPFWLTVGPDGVLSGLPPVSGTFEFDVWVAGADGLSTTNRYRLTIWGGLPMPFIETFENWNTNRWTMEEGALSHWVLANGSSSPASTRYPTKARTGKVNASFYYEDKNGKAKEKLVTPMLNLTRGVENPKLTFWLHMKADGQDQDRLIIHYRTSPTNQWTELQRYLSDIPIWTQMTLDLPNPSDSYQIAFEGIAYYGYSVCIDDIGVNGDPVEDDKDDYEKWKEEYFGDTDIDDEDDADEDGLSNLGEYVMGRNPNDPKDSAESWLDIKIVNGYPNLIFPVGKRAYTNGVIWDLITCTNLLIQNDWVPMNLNISNWVPTASDRLTWWQVVYPDLSSPVDVEPQRFYRLQITVPPKP